MTWPGFWQKSQIGWPSNVLLRKFELLKRWFVALRTSVKSFARFHICLMIGCPEGVWCIVVVTSGHSVRGYDWRGVGFEAVCKD